MAEYIEKKLVLSKSQHDYLEARYDYDDFVLVSDIESIPPADVEPVVRGRWEEVEVTWLADVEDQPDAIASMLCSECRRFANHVHHYGNPCYGMNFCPHCGARMGGDAK